MYSAGTGAGARRRQLVYSCRIASQSRAQTAAGLFTALTFLAVRPVSAVNAGRIRAGAADAPLSAERRLKLMPFVHCTVAIRGGSRAWNSATQKSVECRRRRRYTSLSVALNGNYTTLPSSSVVGASLSVSHALPVASETFLHHALQPGVAKGETPVNVFYRPGNGS